MYTSIRPVRHAERWQCLDALDRLEQRHPLLASWLEQRFAADRAAWTEAMTEANLLQAEAQQALREVTAASRAFVAAFRRWTGTVRDEDGKAAPHQLRPLLGGHLPGHFVRLPRREMVSRAQALLEQLATLKAFPETAWFAGDLERLDALARATEALHAKVAAHEQAQSSKLKASARLTRATAAFDRAWGLVVRMVQQLEGPDGLACLPTFSRKDRKAPSEPEGSAAQPLEPVVERQGATQPEQPGGVRLAPSLGQPPLEIVALHLVEQGGQGEAVAQRPAQDLHGTQRQRGEERDVVGLDPVSPGEGCGADERVP